MIFRSDPLSRRVRLVLPMSQLIPISIIYCLEKGLSKHLREGLEPTAPLYMSRTVPTFIYGL